MFIRVAGNLPPIFIKSFIMQIAVSVIAWHPNEDGQALHIVREAGIKNVEVVPSRVWSAVGGEVFQKEENFFVLLQTEKLSPIAMQSLLYGRPDLSIFGTNDQLEETKSYFSKIIDKASSIGINTLVFGSPKNKLRQGRTKQQADEEASVFFRYVGELSHNRGITFCIEPTPLMYGGDYLSSTREVISLLKQNKVPGLALNLDIGAILSNNEDIETTIELALPYTGHVHISMPKLNRVTTSYELHKSVASALRKGGYEGVVSIEMKTDGENNTNDLPEILRVVRECYE